MMLRAGGYAVITEPGRATREADTFSCRHCNRVQHVRAGARAEDLGGLCKLCMGLICSACVGKPCDVLEKKIERVERTQDMRRWMLECI